MSLLAPERPGADEAGQHYIPPFPPRPAEMPSALGMVRIARHNLLAIWPVRAFRSDITVTRLLRRQVVVVNAPDTIREAFIDRAARCERKSPMQRHALVPLLGDGLFVSDGDTWRERRRVVAPVTHVSRLPELAPAITAGAEERARAWAALPEGAEFDVLAEMAEMTAGIICSTIFGRALGNAAARTVVDAFTQYQSVAAPMDLGLLLGLKRPLPRLPSLRRHRAIRRIHAVLDSLIAAVMASDGAGEQSLLRSMAETTLPASGVPMDRTALRNEAAVLFMAGHETTAAALAWAWFLVSQDAGCEARLHRELDAVLGGRAATFDDLPSLPFTRAVIEETLRLYPPVPIQAREATRPTTIAGRAVEEGALVLLNAWLLHRNPKHWADPDAFVPERFLPGAPPPPRHAYVPFSLGPRVCTGAAFGLTEAVLCLATLAARFRLTLRDGHEVVPVCRLSLRPEGGLPMRLFPRTPGQEGA